MHGRVCCHGSIIPLHFAGQLNRTPDVSAIQVKLWVEVFLRCDGCGVVRAGALGHVTLTERKRFICDAVHQRRLQVVWVDLARRHCGDSYPIVSCMLLSNSQEGLQRSL